MKSFYNYNTFFFSARNLVRKDSWFTVVPVSSVITQLFLNFSFFSQLFFASFFSLVCPHAGRGVTGGYTSFTSVVKNLGDLFCVGSCTWE